MSSEKVKYIKLKNGETFSESIPLSADAVNISVNQEENLAESLSKILTLLGDLRNQTSKLQSGKVDVDVYNQTIEKIQLDLEVLQKDMKSLKDLGLTDTKSTVDTLVTSVSNLTKTVNSLNNEIVSARGEGAENLNETLDNLQTSLEEQMAAVVSKNSFDQTYYATVVKDMSITINPASEVQELNSEKLKLYEYYIYISELADENAEEGTKERYGLFKVYFPSLLPINSVVKATVPRQNTGNIYIDEIADPTATGLWKTTNINLGDQGFSITVSKGEQTITNNFMYGTMNNRITKIFNTSTGDEIDVTYG